MFKNDRMMTMLTGLVLAIFAGTMVQYGDRFMAMISGENQIQTADDFYSVRSGSSQVLNVLANDTVVGPIVVTEQPNCGTVALSGQSQLQYSSTANCSGQIIFSYCVDAADGCVSNKVTLNVISIVGTPNNNQVASAIEIDEPVRDTNFEISETDEVEPSNQEFADNETAAPEVVPTVVANLQENSNGNAAPDFNGIITSLAPPTLVAPSIDEFVSPSAATANIRQQNVVLENTENNTDTSIEAQSSAESVAPVEFGVANFGANVGADESNVILGGTSDNSQQIALQNSPQMTATPADQDEVTAPLDRGPAALAELPNATDNTFGTFKADDQNPGQLMSANDPDAFSTDNIVPTFEIAKVESDQTTLAIEQSGTTALIALQLNGTPLSDAQTAQGNDQQLDLQADTNVAIEAVGALSISPSAIDENSPSVLEREPNASVNDPEFSQTAAYAANGQLADLDVFVAGPDDTVNLNIAENILADIIAGNAPVISNQNASDAFPVRTLPLGDVGDGNANDAEIAMASLSFEGVANTQQKPALDIFVDTTPLVDSKLPAPFIDPNGQTETTTELASLETNENVLIDPTITAPIQQQSTCEIFLDPSVRSGANILLFLIAECKPTTPVTIEHAGLAFTIMTDGEGTANIVIPALQRTAEISASFADGSSASTVALVTQITDVTRAAVTWKGNADLDLHAHEYGAQTNTEGHVWEGAPRDYRSARLKGGGYLVQLGDPSIEGGSMAEVYTMPLGRSVERGTVTMSLEVKNGESVCGNNISARTLRTRPDNNAGSRSIRFTVPDCGASSSARISVPGALDDIRLSSN